MTLGERIRAARKAADLTQRELALALGEHDARLADTYDKTVGEWERDNTPRLPFYAVAAIARATGKPLSFFGDEPQRAELDEAIDEALEVGLPYREIVATITQAATTIAARSEPPAGGRVSRPGRAAKPGASRNVLGAVSGGEEPPGDDPPKRRPRGGGHA